MQLNKEVMGCVFQFVVLFILTACLFNGKGNADMLTGAIVASFTGIGIEAYKKT